jgi:hypothetical protein
MGGKVATKLYNSLKWYMLGFPTPARYSEANHVMVYHDTVGLLCRGKFSNI